MKIITNFLIEKQMVFKLQLFLLCSFIYQLLDPHKKFHVGDKF